MSSHPSRSHHHRRRSHSTSSPTHSQTARCPSNGSWRTIHKRSRPFTLRSPTYRDLASNQPPEKWDVDMWRRGKRARTSSSVRFLSSFTRYRPSLTSALSPQTTVFTGVSSFRDADPPADVPTATAFTYTFPSTSAAFQFFPERHQFNPSVWATRTTEESLHMDDAAAPEPIPTDNVDQLRTDAFGELHRSVAESGEGLVSRMRDWETSHTTSDHRRHSSGSQPQSHWSRKRSVPIQDWSEDESDEDDDIQIISGESSSPAASPRGPPLKKKRAFSLSVMDVDHPTAYAPYLTPDGSERGSSPVDTHFMSVSEMDSDEEVDGGSSPPALTHAFTNSANSSLLSLSLPPPRDRHTEEPPVPLSASRAEKAIAALSLAMASGAGGLNDYETLRTSENKATPALDESLVGEMWH